MTLTTTLFSRSAILEDLDFYPSVTTSAAVAAFGTAAAAAGSSAGCSYVGIKRPGTAITTANADAASTPNRNTAAAAAAAAAINGYAARSARRRR
jgi:hypothetical protein